MSEFLSIPVKDLLDENPFVGDFLQSIDVAVSDESVSVLTLLEAYPSDHWEEQGTTFDDVTEQLTTFINCLNSVEGRTTIESLTVLPGFDKSGNAEACLLELIPGEITCVVGPTGSGKSRLLADIEWLANRDTPTKRQVLLNGKPADEDMVNHFGGKLIAQITQNMNFVLDMSVSEFLLMHAQSRLLENAEAVVDEVIALANELSGEQFNPNTPVTFLSGGQSRALMIADVACIGQAPIVLIDEIENAGVNKKKALDLLVNKDKIVLMATHDPLLILLADKRVVIKNGGMHKVIVTNDFEKNYYRELEQLDLQLQKTKEFFRYGNELSANAKIE